MKKFSILLVLAVLVWACGGNKSDSGTKKSGEEEGINFSKIESGDISGARVYKENCMLCHLATGGGGVSGAKDLGLSELSVVERAEVIYNGRPGTSMMSYENTLKPEQIKAVAEYTMQFKK